MVEERGDGKRGPFASFLSEAVSVIQKSPGGLNGYALKCPPIQRKKNML